MGKPHCYSDKVIDDKASLRANKGKRWYIAGGISGQVDDFNREEQGQGSDGEKVSPDG